MSTPIPPTNPWLRPGQHDAAQTPPERIAALASPAPLPRLQPQAGVDPPATERLPQLMIPPTSTTTLWWVSPHGGGGESCLAELLPDSAATDHRWPIAPECEEHPYVVLVARTHHTGLTATQNAIREWASGSVPIELAGLVLVADAPGRLPKPLRALASLVAGGVSEVWNVPWIDAWRLGEITLDRAPSTVCKLISHLDHSRPPTPRPNTTQRRREIA